MASVLVPQLASRLAPPQLWVSARLAVGGGTDGSSRGHQWLVWRDSQLVASHSLPAPGQGQPATTSTSSSSAAAPHSLTGCSWWECGRDLCVGSVFVSGTEVSLLVCVADRKGRKPVRTHIATCTLDAPAVLLSASPPPPSGSSTSDVSTLCAVYTAAHQTCVISVRTSEVAGTDNATHSSALQVWYAPSSSSAAASQPDAVVQMVWLSTERLAIQYATGRVDAVPTNRDPSSSGCLLCQLPYSSTSSTTSEVVVRMASMPHRDDVVVFAALDVQMRRVRYGAVSLAAATSTLSSTAVSMHEASFSCTSLEAICVGSDGYLYLLARESGSSRSSHNINRRVGGVGTHLAVIQLPRPGFPTSPARPSAMTEADRMALRERSDATLQRLQLPVLLREHGEEGVREALRILSSVEEAALKLEQEEQRLVPRVSAAHSYSRSLLAQCMTLRSQADAYRLLYAFLGCLQTGAAEATLDDEETGRPAAAPEGDAVPPSVIEAILDMPLLSITAPSPCSAPNAKSCTAALLAAALPEALAWEVTARQVFASAPATLQQHYYQPTDVSMGCAALPVEAGLLLLTTVLLVAAAVDVKQQQQKGDASPANAVAAAMRKVASVWVSLQTCNETADAASSSGSSFRTSSLRTWLSTYQLPLIAAHAAFLSVAADLSLAPSQLLPPQQQQLLWLRVCPASLPLSHNLQHHLLARLAQLHWLGTEVGSLMRALQTTLRLPDPLQAADLLREQLIFTSIAAPALYQVPRSSRGSVYHCLLQEEVFIAFSSFSRYAQPCQQTSELRRLALEVYTQLSSETTPLPHVTALLHPQKGNSSDSPSESAWLQQLATRHGRHLWVGQLLLVTRQYDAAREWCLSRLAAGWAGATPHIARILEALEKLKPAEPQYRPAAAASSPRGLSAIGRLAAGGRPRGQPLHTLLLAPQQQRTTVPLEYDTQQLKGSSSTARKGNEMNHGDPYWAGDATILQPSTLLSAA